MSLPGFSRIAIRDPDLADVVQRRCVTDQVDLVLGHAERPREQRRGPADAPGVLAGLVVAILGGDGKALENLDSRVLEVLRPLPHLVLEAQVLLAPGKLEVARPQQVPGAEQHLDGVEWLGEEVVGALRQRALLRVATRVGGEHHDRHAAPLGPGRELLHHLEAVRRRHVEVEQHEVRVRRRAETEDLRRGRGRRQVRVPRLLEDLLEQQDVGRLVVDDQDPCLLEGLVVHPRPGPSRPARHRRSP